MKKKLVWFCLLIMTILAISSTTFAAGYAAKIGNRQYTTLNKAVNAVRRGETITLLKNASWSYPDEEGIAGKKFTIDLAHNILSLNKKLRIGGGANITIKNGTIKGKHDDAVPCFEVGTYAYQKDKRRSKVMFQNCKIRMLKRGLFVDTYSNVDIVMKNSDLSFTNAADYTVFEISDSSTLKVTRGNWKSGKENQEIIQNNGIVKIGKLDYKGRSLLWMGGGSAEITSGTYYLKNARDLITVAGGKLTISGGKFTSETEGLICMSHGKMTMTGGTLRNIQIPVYNTYTPPHETENGNYTPGYSGPVCIHFEAYGDGKAVVKLNGGKVISDHGCCVYRVKKDNARITIDGATCRPLDGAPITFVYSSTG